MKQKKKRCPWCLQVFSSHPRLKDRQKSCGSPDCKHKQKILSHKHWQQKESKIYQQNQKDWRRAHPNYWKNYRQTHPKYTERNRIQSFIRKSFLKSSLQKRIDILQLMEKQIQFWNVCRFVKYPRSMIPLLYANDPSCQGHYVFQSHKKSEVP